MAFWSCKQDPFVKLVRDRFGATVLKVPRTGVDPCDVVARKGDEIQFLGELLTLVDGDPVTLPRVSNELAASLTSIASTTIDIGLGARLTSKFFEALGVPVPEAELQLKVWKGASKFTLELRHVRRREVPLGELGAHLRGRRIRRTPATEKLFGAVGAAQMLIINHTYATPEFAVTTVTNRSVGLEVSAAALKDLAGELEGKVDVARENETTVAFKGRRAVTFAVGAVPCRLDPDGTILDLGFPAGDLVELSGDDAPTDEDARTVGALFDEPGLVELFD